MVTAVSNICATFANARDRDLVLKRKWCLSKLDSTRQLGINKVLTPQQQSQRNALWSTYQQARAQGHRASFPVRLPAIHQRPALGSARAAAGAGSGRRAFFPPMPCRSPQQHPQMLHELSGPSQTLHKNPSQKPFADAPQMLPVLESLPTQSVSLLHPAASWKGPRNWALMSLK